MDDAKESNADTIGVASDDTFGMTPDLDDEAWGLESNGNESVGLGKTGVVVLVETVGETDCTG